MPPAVELEWLFRARTLTWLQSYHLRHIFLCIRADEFSRLLVGGRAVGLRGRPGRPQLGGRTVP